MAEDEAGRYEKIRFPSLDGFPLGGILFSQSTPQPPMNAAVFAPGGGTRAIVYHRFLSYLATSGMPVLAFDYRGIGDSRPTRMRGLAAGFEDWAELDTGAAIQWMRSRYPEAKLAGIGHSIGAVMIVAPIAAQHFGQIVCIAPHTGYFGDYRLDLRWFMNSVWRLSAALFVPLLGYFPAKRLGFCEDLPARVAKQWSACTSPGFDAGLAHGDAQRGRRLLSQAASLRAPTLVLSFPDDPWSTEIGIRRFLHGCQNLLAVRRVVKPSDVGVRHIGHWGFFRRTSARSLWPLVAKFLLSEESLELKRCTSVGYG